MKEWRRGCSYVGTNLHFSTSLGKRMNYLWTRRRKSCICEGQHGSVLDSIQEDSLDVYHLMPVDYRRNSKQPVRIQVHAAMTRLVSEFSSDMGFMKNPQNLPKCWEEKSWFKTFSETKECDTTSPWQNGMNFSVSHSSSSDPRVTQNQAWQDERRGETLAKVEGRNYLSLFLSCRLLTATGQRWG